MDEFYPSEVARLVLGYLKDVKCLESWQTFLQESSHLQEHYLLHKEGKYHTTNVNGKSLLEILTEYCALKSESINNEKNKAKTSSQSSCAENIRTPSKANPNAFNRFRVNQKMQTQSVSFNYGQGPLASPSLNYYFRSPTSRPTIRTPRRRLESRETPLNFGPDAEAIPVVNNSGNIRNGTTTSQPSSNHQQSNASELDIRRYTDPGVSTRSRFQDRVVQTDILAKERCSSHSLNNTQADSCILSSSGVSHRSTDSPFMIEDSAKNDSVPHPPPQIVNESNPTPAENSESEVAVASPAVLSKSVVYRSSEITASDGNIIITTTESSLTPQYHGEPPEYNRAPNTNSPRIVLSYDRSQISSLTTPMKDKRCWIDDISSPKRKGFIPRRRLLSESPMSKQSQYSEVPSFATMHEEMAILEEFFSYQPLAEKIAENINKAKCSDEPKESDGSHSYTTLQDIPGSEEMIKNVLARTAADPVFDEYLNLLCGSKDVSENNNLQESVNTKATSKACGTEQSNSSTPGEGSQSIPKSSSDIVANTTVCSVDTTENATRSSNLPRTELSKVSKESVTDAETDNAGNINSTFDRKVNNFSEKTVYASIPDSSNLQKYTSEQEAMEFSNPTAVENSSSYCSDVTAVDVPDSAFFNAETNNCVTEGAHNLNSVPCNSDVSGQATLVSNSDAVTDNNQDSTVTHAKVGSNVVEMETNRTENTSEVAAQNTVTLNTDNSGNFSETAGKVKPIAPAKPVFEIPYPTVPTLLVPSFGQDVFQLPNNFQYRIIINQTPGVDLGTSGCETYIPILPSSTVNPVLTMGTVASNPVGITSMENVCVNNAAPLDIRLPTKPVESATPFNFSPPKPAVGTKSPLKRTENTKHWRKKEGNKRSNKRKAGQSSPIHRQVPSKKTCPQFSTPPHEAQNILNNDNIPTISIPESCSDTSQTALELFSTITNKSEVQSPILKMLLSSAEMIAKEARQSKGSHVRRLDYGSAAPAQETGDAEKTKHASSRRSARIQKLNSSNQVLKNSPDIVNDMPIVSVSKNKRKMESPRKMVRADKFLEFPNDATKAVLNCMENARKNAVLEGRQNHVELMDICDSPDKSNPPVNTLNQNSVSAEDCGTGFAMDSYHVDVMPTHEYFPDSDLSDVACEIDSGGKDLPVESSLKNSVANNADVALENSSVSKKKLAKKSVIQSVPRKKTKKVKKKKTDPKFKAKNSLQDCDSDVNSLAKSVSHLKQISSKSTSKEGSECSDDGTVEHKQVDTATTCSNKSKTFNAVDGNSMHDREQMSSEKDTTVQSMPRKETNWKAKCVSSCIDAESSSAPKVIDLNCKVTENSTSAESTVITENICVSEKRLQQSCSSSVNLSTQPPKNLSDEISGRTAMGTQSNEEQQPHTVLNDNVISNMSPVKSNSLTSEPSIPAKSPSKLASSPKIQHSVSSNISTSLVANAISNMSPTKSNSLESEPLTTAKSPCKSPSKWPSSPKVQHSVLPNISNSLDANVISNISPAKSNSLESEPSTAAKSPCKSPSKLASPEVQHLVSPSVSTNSVAAFTYVRPPDIAAILKKYANVDKNSTLTPPKSPEHEVSPFMASLLAPLERSPEIEAIMLKWGPKVKKADDSEKNESSKTEPAKQKSPRTNCITSYFHPANNNSHSSKVSKDDSNGICHNPEFLVREGASQRKISLSEQNSQMLHPNVKSGSTSIDSMSSHVDPILKNRLCDTEAAEYLNENECTRENPLCESGTDRSNLTNTVPFEKSSNHLSISDKNQTDNNFAAVNEVSMLDVNEKSVSQAKNQSASHKDELFHRTTTEKNSTIFSEKVSDNAKSVAEKSSLNSSKVSSLLDNSSNAFQDPLSFIMKKVFCDMSISSPRRADSPHAAPGVGGNDNNTCFPEILARNTEQSVVAERTFKSLDSFPSKTRNSVKDASPFSVVKESGKQNDQKERLIQKLSPIKSPISALQKAPKGKSLSRSKISKDNAQSSEELSDVNIHTESRRRSDSVEITDSASEKSGILEIDETFTDSFESCDSDGVKPGVADFKLRKSVPSHKKKSNSRVSPRKHKTDNYGKTEKTCGKIITKDKPYLKKTQISGVGEGLKNETELLSTDKAMSQNKLETVLNSSSKKPSPKHKSPTKELRQKLKDTSTGDERQLSTSNQCLSNPSKSPVDNFSVQEVSDKQLPKVNADGKLTATKSKSPCRAVPPPKKRIRPVPVTSPNSSPKFIVYSPFKDACVFTSHTSSSTSSIAQPIKNTSRISGLEPGAANESSHSSSSKQTEKVSDPSIKSGAESASAKQQFSFKVPYSSPSPKSKNLRSSALGPSSPPTALSGKPKAMAEIYRNAFPNRDIPISRGSFSDSATNSNTADAFLAKRQLLQSSDMDTMQSRHAESPKKFGDEFISCFPGRKRKLSESLFTDTSSTLVDCSDLEITTPEKDDFKVAVFCSNSSPIARKKRTVQKLVSSPDITPEKGSATNLFNKEACKTSVKAAANIFPHLLANMNPKKLPEPEKPDSAHSVAKNPSMNIVSSTVNPLNVPSSYSTEVAVKKRIAHRSAHQKSFSAHQSPVKQRHSTKKSPSSGRSPKKIDKKSPQKSGAKKSSHSQPSSSVENTSIKKTSHTKSQNIGKKSSEKKEVIKNCSVQLERMKDVQMRDIRSGATVEPQQSSSQTVQESPVRSDTKSVVSRSVLSKKTEQDPCIPPGVKIPSKWNSSKINKYSNAIVVSSDSGKRPRRSRPSIKIATLKSPGNLSKEAENQMCQDKAKEKNTFEEKFEDSHSDFSMGSSPSRPPEKETTKHRKKSLKKSSSVHPDFMIQRNRLSEKNVIKTYSQASSSKATLHQSKKYLDFENTVDLVESDIGRSNEEGSELANAIAFLTTEMPPICETPQKVKDGVADTLEKPVLSEDEPSEKLETPSKSDSGLDKFSMILNKIKADGLDFVWDLLEKASKS